MKTIGLLGGMSWESTLDYYRDLNEGIKERLGGLHSARLVLYSVDFDPLEKLMRKGDWHATAAILCEAAQKVQNAGADCLLICTNTMHKVAPQIEAAITIPVLHIADATAGVLLQEGIQTVGLLGTAFTMEEDFYKGRLADKFGLEVLTPQRSDRQTVHDIIFKELCVGKLHSESKNAYLRVIAQLAEDGAEAVILGCTEIGMLIKQSDTAIQLFDTTTLHAQKAIDFALQH